MPKIEELSRKIIEHQIKCKLLGPHNSLCFSLSYHLILFSACDSPLDYGYLEDNNCVWFISISGI